MAESVCRRFWRRAEKLGDPGALSCSPLAATRSWILCSDRISIPIHPIISKASKPPGLYLEYTRYKLGKLCVAQYIFVMPSAAATMNKNLSRPKNNTNRLVNDVIMGQRRRKPAVRAWQRPGQAGAATPAAPVAEVEAPESLLLKAGSGIIVKAGSKE